jgi:hypothetical protein
VNLLIYIVATVIKEEHYIYKLVMGKNIKLKTLNLLTAEEIQVIQMVDMEEEYMFVMVEMITQDH